MALLDDAIAAEVTELSERGDDDLEHGRNADAAEKYLRALSLLPEPRRAWNAATWLYTAVGEARLADGRFEEARDALVEAIGCESGSGNALVHLRLAQAEHALGNLGTAREELRRAYERGGRLIFEGEDPALVGLIADVLEAPDAP